MGKAETKYANTAKKMDDALIALLEEKPFDSITVTDVCKTAGVNRSTFYAHYNNTLELLGEVKASLMESFYGSFSHLDYETDYLSRKYLDTYLKFIEENRSIFGVVLSNHALFDSAETFECMVQFTKRNGMPGTKTTSNIVRYKLTYMAAGITAIVSTWLQGGCKESRSRMIDIILKCTEGVERP